MTRPLHLADVRSAGPTKESCPHGLHLVLISVLQDELELKRLSEVEKRALRFKALLTVRQVEACCRTAGLCVCVCMIPAA